MNNSPRPVSGSGYQKPRLISILKHGTGILALTAACTFASVLPAPDECRSVGVSVPDNAPIRGSIVSEHYGTPQEVSAACQSPFAPKRGCAIVVWPGTESTQPEWVLYAVNERVMLHERCHALYSTGDHQ